MEEKLKTALVSIVGEKNYTDDLIDMVSTHTMPLSTAIGLPAGYGWNQPSRSPRSSNSPTARKSR